MENRVARKFIGPIMVLLALLLAHPPPASPQVAGDTIQITVQGLLTDAEISFPAPSMLPGDTMYFTARATDSDGDPVIALFTWGSSDTTVVKVYQTNDSTAMAVAIRKGQVLIGLLAEQYDFLAVAFRMPDGSFRLGKATISIGERIQGCGFLLRGSTLVATSDPICLDYAGPIPRGPNYAVWKGPQRWDTWQRSRVRAAQG